MADISQLEINGTTYNICDATARDNYLPLSGGHMTGGVTFDSGGISITNSGMTVKTGLVVSDGNFYSNSTGVDRNGAAPSTDQIRGVYLRDKDNEALAVFQSIYRSSGRSDAGVYAYNSANGEAAGSNTQCFLRMQVDKDGTQSYALSSPSAFRKAISGIWPIYPDIKRGTAPSSTTYSEGLQWYDNKSSPSRLGFVRTNYQADGKNALQLTACNSNAAGTTEYTNSINIMVSNTGVQSYSVGDPAAFRSAIGASSGIWPVSLGGTGASSVASALSNLNIKSTSCTRKLGSGGSAYAFRVGNLLIVAGKYTGCSVSSTYTWTNTAQFTLSNLGISSVTCLGCYADVSGGGPSYDGSTNTGALLESNTVRIQTNVAFSDKTVRFICIGYCS